ncbi:MAG TPA: PH domain-containing protein [Candidatus Deferrimicrobium sp.]|nr:PH domain-containing protein [Candidatus Deferrimicrobium sp.]
MGTYAESLLTPDEKVIMRQRQHWLVLILDSWLAIIFWGAAIVLLLLRLFVPDEFFGVSLTSGTIGETFVLLILLTLLGGIIVVALRWWWWRTQEFLVTNRRLMLAWGVLNKSSSDSSLEKINDLQLDISALGRLLDFGSLKVMTAAPMQGAEYLDRLNHAKAFKKTLMTAKHDLQMSQGTDGEDYMKSRSSTKPPAAGVAAPAPSPVSTPAATAAGAGSSAAGRIDVSGGADPLRADTPEEVTAVLAQLTRLRDDGHLTTEEYEAKKRELLGRL